MFNLQNQANREQDFESSVLEFIAKNLAVPVLDLSQYFDLPEAQVQEKLQPLVSRRFVREQHPGGGLVYSITADGIKEVERSVRTGLAAYL